MLTYHIEYVFNAVECRQKLSHVYEFVNSPGEMCSEFDLLPTPPFLEEIIGRHAGMITIFGSAGSGKTVLSRQISKAEVSSSKNAVVLAFYFDESDYRTRSYRDMLLSFILQLLYQKQMAFDSAYVQDIYSSMDIHSDVPWPDLYRLLYGMLLRLSGTPVNCIIDGVDKCDDISQSQLIGDFGRMIYNGPTRCRVFLTCRPSNSILKLLQPLNDTNSVNLDDSMEYARDRILGDDLTRDESSVLRDHLERENATPLKTKLLTTLLRMGEVSDVQEYVNYAELYAQIIARIQAPSWWLRDLLLCLAFAKRPLTVNELSMAMGVGRSQSLVEGKLVLSELQIAAPKQLQEDIQLAMTPLLRIEYGVVHLIHGTLRDVVQDHLSIASKNLWTEPMQHEQVNGRLEMLRRCFLTITISELRDIKHLPTKRRPFDTFCDLSVDLKPYSFASYAGSCLMYHIRDIDHKSDDKGKITEVINNNLPLFWDDVAVRSWWMETFKPTRSQPTVTMDQTELSEKFQLAASLGFHTVLQSMLPLIDDQVDMESAICAAVRSGDIETARLLLSLEANKNKGMWIISLKESFEYGCADLARRIVSWWDDAQEQTSKDDFYHSLERLAENGHWDIISRLVEDFNKLVNLLDQEDLKSLITISAKSGRDGAISEFLAIDEFIQKNTEATELSDNAEKESEDCEMTEETDQTADGNPETATTTDCDSTNAEQQNDDDEAVPGKVMIDIKDTNKEHRFSAALISAAEYGNPAVIRLLIPQASLEYRDENEALSWTALHTAAWGKPVSQARSFA